MSVRISVLGVDGRGNRPHGVEQQPLDIAEQAHAMERHSGVIADGGEELEILLAEAARATLAVHIEGSEYLVGRPQRDAHHRADTLADDALAKREA